jgi:imidazolonepropionase-like amidohydrolase
MRSSLVLFASPSLLPLALVCLLPSRVQAEQVRFDLYKWQHRIGTEIASVERGKTGTDIRVAFAFTDRATTVPLAASLQIGADGTARRFQVWGNTSRRSDVDDLVTVAGKKITVRRHGRVQTVATPPRFFVASAYAPVIVAEELLRYWAGHGRPARLPVFPLGEVTIEPRGEDRVENDAGKTVTLQRYAIGGFGWGKETVWLDASGALVALKGIDSEQDHFEATRTGYSQALAVLVARAGEDAMAALAETARGLIGSSGGGATAYLGMRLVDGTGRPAVPDAAVVVQDGKIVAAGARSSVSLPPGAWTVRLEGRTMLPGLWDMHAHFAQVEWGPLYLAAGVTTVRDCANELDFIRSVRATIESGKGIGPRILLACLVDGEGEAVIGNERLRSADQIPALIEKLRAARCDQVKIYSGFDPALIAPLARAAHQVGMTVTGHVPNGIGAMRAVQAGLDQINHVTYLARALAPPSYPPDAVLPRAVQMRAFEEIDLASPTARAALAFFGQRGTVVDPTVALFELFSYPHEQLARREPGLAKVAPPLRASLSTYGATADGRSHARFTRYLEVIGALHKAGVPIVAGTDQAVPGHSLHRELELYVQAGLSPMAAIQAATVVPARAMKQEQHAGTVEPGKRADLIVVEGDPLQQIQALRRLTLVVAGGRELEPAKMWRSVGFQP